MDNNTLFEDFNNKWMEGYFDTDNHKTFSIKKVREFFENALSEAYQQGYRDGELEAGELLQ